MTGVRSQATDQGPEARVSLRDLLSVPSFGLRLMAAPDRVDTPVRWAHPTELIDPRPYLSGQELVLTVGTSLQDDQRCRDFVDHLLEAGVTALGYGVGDVTNEIPEALLKECRSRGLPLLQVPSGVPFQSITEMLADRRAEARTARSRRVQQLVVRLLDAIGLDRPVADLLDIISADLGGRIGFHEGSIDWQPAQESDVRPGQDTLQHLSRVLAVRQHEEDTDLAKRRLEMGRLVELVVQGRADAEVLEHPLDAAGVGTEKPVVVAAWPPRAAELVASLLDCCLVAEFDDVTVTLSGDLEQILEVARETALPCGIGAPAPLAELRHGQLDQDSLPPYELLDEILDRYVEGAQDRAELVEAGFDASVVEHVVMLVDRAEWKRRQFAPGPKISSLAFGRDRRLPITNRWRGHH